MADDLEDLFKELGKHTGKILEDWESIADAIDARSDETKKLESLFEELSSLGDEILKEWENTADVIDASVGSVAALEASQKRILEDIERQREELDYIAALMSPEVLEKRVSAEREIAKARKEAAEATLKEQVRQAGGAMGYAGEKVMGSIPGLVHAAAGGNALPTAGGMVGGAIGEALGGPIGKALGEEVGRAMAKAGPELLAAPMKGVSEGLKGLALVLQGLQGTLGPIGAGFDLMSLAAHKWADHVKEIPIIGEVLGPMMDAIAVIPDTIKQITEALVGMAAKASPTAMKQFQYAVDDVQGVIGQSFLPVLDLMRDAIRLVGDALANILPSSNEVYAALGPLREAFAGMGDSLRELMQDIGPLIRGELVLALQVLGAELSAVAKVVGYVAKGLSVLLTPLRMLMQFLGVDTSLRSSVGAAYRGPASTHGFEDYEKQLQESAFSEPGRPTQQDIPTTVANIRDLLQIMVDWTHLLTPAGIATALKEAVLGGVGGGFEPPRSATEAFRDTLKLNPLTRPIGSLIDLLPGFPGG